MLNIIFFRCRFVLMLLAVVASFVASLPISSADEKKVAPDHAADMERGLELFRKEVRTIFAGRCLKCHGGESTEGEFSLATRKDLLHGGDTGKAIDLKNDSMQSLLLKMIRHEVEPVMPDDGAKLSKRQIELIEQWVKLGAPYDKPLQTNEDEAPDAWTRKKIDPSSRQFWSFQPLANVSVPKGDDSWARTSIDRFVLQALSDKGISPNKLADKRTLLRRAYFDLIGLPPTQSETQQFLTDESPDAYERLLDRLLNNKHHGERVGRHWLDLVRFAESHGFEQDYDRPHAYHYRDFVIKAFNQDMPFDQFVHWQIAGDEFEPNNPLALMATGFLGAGVFPTQLTEKEFESSRYDELDDMVATLGTSMLGITVGCARCHDHKFDPIPSRDYYQLVSAFRTAIRSNIDLALDPEGDQKAIAQWNEKLGPLKAALAAFEKNQLPGRFEEFIANARAKPESDDSLPNDQAKWISIDAVKISSKQGATFTKQEDGSYLVTGKNANTDTYVIQSAAISGPVTAIRLEALPDKSMKGGGPGRAGNGNFGLSRISATYLKLNADGTPNKGQKPIPVELHKPQVTFEQNNTTLSIASSLDNNTKSGWAVDPQFGKRHAASFALKQPIDSSTAIQLTIKLEFALNTKHNMGRIRLALNHALERPALDAESGDSSRWIIANFRLGKDEVLDPKRREEILRAFKRTDPGWTKHNERLQNHLAAKPSPKLTKVMVTSEGVKPIPNHGDGRGFPHFYKDFYFLNRGDVNQKQGIAEAGYLQVLMKSGTKDDPWASEPSEGATTSFRRSAVANWITDTDRGAGHLLARVIVNRLLAQHLGRGIVGTPNDFGFQGDRPTNPELLDWLASELIRNDWRLKPIRKLIMTSSVYMQSADHDPGRAKIDPQNALYWRYTPRRLEAEVIRDAMLSVSGQLDESQFGPGTLDSNMRRRSIYFMIKRSKLIPFLQVFDTPEPLASVGNRPATTVAPQALILMNSPQVRRYATEFARKLGSHQDFGAVIDHAYQNAIARSPNASEAERGMTFLSHQFKSYESEGKTNARELAIADYCQVLFSLSEFIYID